MIRQAKEDDKEQIVKLFSENIVSQKSYISHGEIQMGIALDVGILSENHTILWRAYLDAQMKDFANTIVVYEKNNTIEGFIIGEISKDRNEFFGVICDVVVSNDLRHKGIGALLLNSLIKIFRSKGICEYYLESGINNHEAHEFFENKGFSKVSVIYRRRDE